jgi:hypothetical protein
MVGMIRTYWSTVGTHSTLKEQTIPPLFSFSNPRPRTIVTLEARRDLVTVLKLKSFNQYQTINDEETILKGEGRTRQS